MDLTLFILFIIFCFMLYYLVASIQSLIQEIKEVKNKCIWTQNAKVTDFKVDTADPAELMKKKAVDTFTTVKYMLGQTS